MRIVKNILLAVLLILTGIVLTAKFDWTNEVAASENDYQIIESGEEHSRFAVIAKKVMPAIVSIRVERSIEYKFESPFDHFFDLDDFFGRQDRSRKRKPQIRKQIQKSSGSGFIYSTDGYIMTNNHVVEKADTIIVKTSDGKEYPAEIIGTDPETDLAVIKVDHAFTTKQVVEQGDSDKLWTGDWVIAIGSPYNLDKTVTVGVVSAKGRSGIGIYQGPVYQDFIQTDAAINPGNSGGPLLDISGKVIGINAAINAQAQGIGFAIPINLAKRIEKQLQETGIVKRGYIGIQLKEIREDEKAPYGLGNDEFGVLISRVESNTPAENAGLRDDDIILELNGKKIKNYERFRLNVASFPPDTEIELAVLREGSKKRFTVKLGDRNKFLGVSVNEMPKESKEYLGLSVRDLDENLRRNYKIDINKGVFVEKVSKDSKLNGKITTGDVIFKIISESKHYRIENSNDFRNGLEKVKKSGKSFVIRFIRNGRRRYVVVK